jgi:DNA-3-methyladenine glycosylase II
MSLSERQEHIQKGLHHLCSYDPKLDEVITSIDSIFSVEKHENYYEALVRAIISQQLSVAAADTIERRLRGLFAENTPTPQELLKLSDEELRRVGISSNKAGYLKDLAGQINHGELDLDALSVAPDDQVTTHLIKVKGIGVWTAQMFLLFCLGRLDVLPSGDLGIQVGIEQLYELSERPTPKRVEKIAEDKHWHPYASIASWYIWRNKK